MQFYCSRGGVMKLIKLCVLSTFLLWSFLLNATPVGSFQQIAGSPFTAGTNPASSAYSPSEDIYINTPPIQASRNPLVISGRMARSDRLLLDYWSALKVYPG